MYNFPGKGKVLMEKKYFFFDIDGTLTVAARDASYVPESTKRALAKLRENGHFLAIATGRSYAKALPVMKALGFENMVHDGGYGITLNNELIDIEPLNRDDCIALVRECEAKGILWGIQPENSDTRFVPDERFMEFTHDQYMKSMIVPGLDPENYEKIYKVYVACYEPVEHSLETLKKLPWCRFMKEYIFVEPSDKARGIRRIVDHFGGDYRDVVVFGDHRNDLSMFTGEWTGIAMGNAVEELKAKADFVTSDIEDDGIWNACVRYGWI